MSSIELIFSRRAESNIRNILQYTRKTWGRAQEEAAQADTYVQLVDAAFRRIQAFPDIGRVTDEDRPTLREYHLEHHTILYRHDPGAVTILRVINPRRWRRR